MNASDQHLTTVKPEVVQATRQQMPLGLPDTQLAVAESHPLHDLTSYAEIPFMHKRLIVRCVVGCLALGWMAILFWPRKYESEAKLIIRVGRESVSLDPTATTSQTLMLQKTQEEEINSALEVLSSRKVAALVVEELGPDNVLEGVLPTEGESAKPSWISSSIQSAKRTASDAAFYCMLAVGLKDNISERELAVRRVQSTVDIFAPKKSTVITVHAESKTPQMAQALAQQVTDSFLEQHLEVSRTDGSLEFFTKQSDAAEKELNALIDRHTKFKQEHKIVSVEANRTLLKEQLSAVDRDVILAGGELEQALAEIEDIKARLHETPDEIIAAKLEGSDQTWSAMRQRVYELELEEKRLASIYTEDHRSLIQVREQLEGARQILDKSQSARVDSNTTPNPAKRRMEEDLQKQQTRIVGLRSMLDKKEKQRTQIYGEVNALSDFELELTQMEREISLMETSLHVLREKLEEARVIDELQQGRISNVSVFQPATFVERAVSPKKRVLAAAFVLMGVGLGVGLAFLRQASSRSLRTIQDVESHLSFGVIAQIPKLKRVQAHLTNPVIRDQARRIISEVLLSPRHGPDTKGQSLGVLGVSAGNGASTLAAYLAVASRDDCGLKTIAVDADAKSRTLSTTFGLNGSPGLVELLSGDASHEECLQHSGQADIDLISCSSGKSQRLPAHADEIVGALNAYRHSCDLLIVDLPPANRPDHAINLAQHLDSVIVVVESEQADAAATERLLQRLAASQTQVIGVVLNKTKNYLPKWLRRSVAPSV